MAHTGEDVLVSGGQGQPVDEMLTTITGDHAADPSLGVSAALSRA